MEKTAPRSPQPHRHSVVKLHVLKQREGVPYEIERTMCSDCRRVLDERRLKRAAA